jgi:acetyltransferase-like isoleucine patch superfamily enzyme
MIITKIKNFLNLPFSKKYFFFRYHSYRLSTIIKYSYQLKSLGKNSVLIKPLKITPEYLSVGDNVSIDYHGRIEAIECYSNITYEPNIILEDGVTFEQRCHITAASELIVGANTIASFDVMITDIDHNYEEIGIPIGKQKITVNRTKIGKNCFIGSGVKIQAGTTLGCHCVIGANSVVRGIFPDYSVIVGVPARIVKRFDFNSNSWRKTSPNGSFIE